MTKIYVNHRTGPYSIPAPFSYNDLSSVTAIGVAVADLNDDTNTATGVSYSIATNAFGGAAGGSTNATADAGEFVDNVLDYYNFFPVGSPPDLVFAGLPASTSVTFTFVGHQDSQAARDTTATIGDSSATYDNNANAAAPAAPVSVSGTTDGSGNLTVSLSGNSSFGYLNAFTLEHTDGLTIDSTDASMQRDTNWQMVVSNPSTAPTTLNTTLTNDTTVLTPSSVTGSGPYTLTFPVGDMDKQVDATGYPWTLDVDGETVVTANIPLTIQAGYTLVDLVDPVTTNASLLFGADRDAPVTGDHLEHTVTSTLDDTIALNVAASGVWTITNVDNWVTDITVSRRVVQVDGSIGTEAVLTLNAATGVAVVKRYTLFDFGTVLPLGNANSINTTNVGQKVANAIDTDGSSTGISLSVAEEFDGQSDNTVDFPNGNPWGAENNIARDCVFTNGVGNGSIVLSGLNDSLIYTIELASYRTGSGDQYTDFTINGTTQTVFSKGDTSVGGTTSFDVTPSSGSITIDVNESDGYTVGYLNAMRLSWPISSLGLGVVTDIVTGMVTGLVTDMVN